ncbi:MAG: MCP four helix bundle domain-containing protein, partial [Methylophilaceae bacterium]
MKLTVAGRIKALVAVAILGFVILTSVAYYEIKAVYHESEVVVTYVLPSINALDVIKGNFLRIRINLGKHVNATDPEQRKYNEERIYQLDKELKESLDKYGKDLISDPEDQRLYDIDKAALSTYLTEAEKILTLSQQSTSNPALLDEAKQRLTENEKQALNVIKLIEDHIKFNHELAANALHQATAAKDTALNLSIGIVIIALFVLVVSGYVILKTILRELGGEPTQLASLARSFAAGDLSAEIKLPDTDKTSVAYSIRRLQKTLKGLIDSLQYVSASHDKGDIDETLKAEYFEGVFREVAQAINTMVGGHVGMNRKAMDVVAAFGEGNFDAPLEKFPGKKAFINDTIEKVRSNIKSFITDMQQMSSNHAVGEIDVMIDVSKYHGDYATMATGVNTMVSDYIDV